MGTMRQLQRDFANWVDQLCRGPIPATAQAFNFNMYECDGCFQAELIGAPRFDPEDEDWACYEEYTSRPARFDLPHAIVGDKWEPALALVSDWVRSYLADRSNGGARLRESVAVTVGFVDGNLVRVWPVEATASAPPQ